MNERRTYPVFLWINHTLVNELIIDSHYQDHHSDHMSDELIIALIESLKKVRFELDSTKGKYRYFLFNPHFYLGKAYRIVLLMEDGKNYIGVVNAFRR